MFYIVSLPFLLYFHSMEKNKPFFTESHQHDNFVPFHYKEYALEVYRHCVRAHPQISAALVRVPLHNNATSV